MVRLFYGCIDQIFFDRNSPPSSLDHTLLFGDSVDRQVNRVSIPTCFVVRNPVTCQTTDGLREESDQDVVDNEKNIIILSRS